MHCTKQEINNLKLFLYVYVLKYLILKGSILIKSGYMFVKEIGIGNTFCVKNQYAGSRIYFQSMS